jgi:hypothetical protein
MSSGEGTMDSKERRRRDLVVASGVRELPGRAVLGAVLGAEMNA